TAAALCGGCVLPPPCVYKMHMKSRACRMAGPPCPNDSFGPLSKFDQGPAVGYTNRLSMARARVVNRRFSTGFTFISAYCKAATIHGEQIEASDRGGNHQDAEVG